MSVDKAISVSDGMLDVIVARYASVSSRIAVGDQILGRDLKPGAVKHWQGSEIAIECDPTHTIQLDGEVWDPTPVSTKVLPGVLPVLTISED